MKRKSGCERPARRSGGKTWALIGLGAVGAAILAALWVATASE